jgi:N-acetylneuraminic acid mutarotase
MQNEREAAQAAFINGKLYVVGGWNRFGQPVPQLEIYDPGSRTWSAGAPDPAPYAGAGTAVVSGRMYVIGGCAGICTASQVEVYDPAANAWSAAAPYPVGAGWLGCGTIAGNIYCAGGVAYQTGITNAYAYSPSSGAWFAISPLPIDLWGGGYTAANGELLISGGVTSQGTTLTNQGFAYDPSLGAWSALPNSGAPVYRAGSGCGLYLIGGSTGGLNPAYAAQQLPGYAACGSAQVPWLAASPGSFTVNPGATVIVTETLNAGAPSVTQPGAYTASLAIRDDTPYLTPGTVAVTMDAG